MDYLPYSQEYMLAVSVMGGMLLGFIWDIYRLVRHYTKLSAFATAIGDILYWLISIYIGIQLIFDISFGNVRFFILIGFISGALLYFYGISRYILKAAIFIVDAILKFIKKIISLLIDPIKYVANMLINKFKILLYPIKLKYEKTRNTAKKRYKFFKFRVKKLSKNKKMIYNKKRHLRKMKKRKRGKRTIERRSKNYRTKEKNQ
ncbi:MULTISPECIES: spore cortex biosynthesis protein YabQ [unclassified Sedimentibacter]|uniref:spore cortex biosynthesis protein YabQ n=1 Tax=unclassified Sedimentibacter TaxID=2649220 RepID=UPI0027E0EDF1|nr:spore cortex biosynthesis protein YabQ [Sedimentibacter sp. MB35-C1]WMJ76757.1 spore cortex biosynthesis protein YabQ [Sedimentibacter sp. MB35-C1]